MRGVEEFVLNTSSISYIKTNNMKKSALVIIAMLSFNVTFLHAQEPAREPEISIETLVREGGPVYQKLNKRLSSVQWDKDLKTQDIPKIYADEIEAFNREKIQVKKMQSSAANHVLRKPVVKDFELYINYRAEAQADRLFNVLFFKYNPLGARIEQLKKQRPDVIK